MSQAFFLELNDNVIIYNKHFLINQGETYIYGTHAKCG